MFVREEVKIYRTKMKKGISILLTVQVEIFRCASKKN
jgi:hypothetical protein